MAQRKGKTPARKNINGIPLENDTTKSLEKYFQGNEGPTIQKTETSDLTPLHFNKQNKNGVTYTFQLKGIWEEQIIINYFNTFLISPSNKFLKNPQRCLICMACFYFSVHSINSPLKEKNSTPPPKYPNTNQANGQEGNDFRRWIRKRAQTMALWASVSFLSPPQSPQVLMGAPSESG